MKATARLVVSLGDEAAAKALSDVLAPDNEGLPTGLEFTQKSQARTVRIVASSASPSTAISTALAVLRDATLFQQVWLLSRSKPTVGSGSEGK